MSTDKEESVFGNKVIEVTTAMSKPSDPMTDLASKIHDLIVGSGVKSYEAVGALQLCQAVWNETYRDRIFAFNMANKKKPSST